MPGRHVINTEYTAFVALNSSSSSFPHMETEALFHLLHLKCVCTHKETRQRRACWGLARIDNPQVYETRFSTKAFNLDL